MSFTIWWMKPISLLGSFPFFMSSPRRLQRILRKYSWRG